MKFVFISDTHNRLQTMQVPRGDVLIHCGDFTMVGRPDEVTAFNAQLALLPHEHKIVIAGNHEFLFESQPEYAKQLLTAATYLQDSSITIKGIKIYGSPWQPAFHDWAFNVPRQSQRLDDIWTAIPDDTDVLVTHGPPHGILDRTAFGTLAGCELLLKHVTRVKPKVHCFGHIHEGYGESNLHGTRFINASNVNEHYRVSNAPIVIEL